MILFKATIGFIVCLAWAFIAREVWKRDTTNRRNLEKPWEEFSPG